MAYFLAPFMVDANNEVSEKVTLDYRHTGGKEQLVVTADQEWLKESSRRYPVRIDPTIVVGSSYDVLKDTFVSDWYPENSFSSYDFLSSGYDASTYGKTRSFLQFVLPNLPSSSTITGATLSLYQYINNTSTTVDVHKITSYWTASGTTWNAQPSFSTTPESSITGSAAGYWDFEITEPVQSWYNTTAPNFGIAVKHRSETGAVKQFISSDGTNNLPKLTINFKVDPIGQEDQWGFTPEGANGFNGNLVQQVTDLVIPGRGIPVSFSRVYNSRSTKDGILGYGWVSNVGASIKDSGYGPVVLTDEDGTEHIFTQLPDGSLAGPKGVYLKMEYINNQYVVTRTDGVKIYFNSSGQLIKITDTSKAPNTTTYNYDTSGKLSGITDASGRVTNFYYNIDGTLSKITDPAGRSVQYGYDANANLTSVTDRAGKVTTYSYDANHNLTGITDPNGKTVTYGYDTAIDKITSISRTITVKGTPTTATTSFSYNTATNTTTRTDARNNKINYIYDDEGKIKEIIGDPGGLNYSTKFGYDQDNNINRITDPKNGAYTASYELGTGNLIDETNPLNEKYQYSYDSGNNLTEQVDPENRVNDFSYDSYNNNIENTDPFTQTDATRYFDNGNVDYETSTISANENLVTNSSAERDANGDGWSDRWNKYSESGKSADIFWSTISRFGGRSLGIGDTTGWATVMNTRATFFDSAQTYVLSGYVKTNNLSKKAAFIKADCYDASDSWIGEVRSPVLGGTSDWTRVQLILDSHNIPDGTVKFYTSVGREASTGYSRYDGLQVEVGTVMSSYNMVENSSFELDLDGNGIPDQWETNFAPGTGEGLDTTFKYAGSASFKVTGQAGVNKYIKQHIDAQGDQNNQLNLSGWSYADNPDPYGGYYNLQVAINYTDGTVDWRYANDFTKKDHTESGWEHVVAQIKPSQAFSSLDIYYCFYNQSGNAWFDAVRLQEGNNITGYSYDANGNYITGITDPLNNKTNLEYDTLGNRTKIIDPKGNTTAYVYDLMNRLTQLTDALQGITKYDYDDSGNRVTVTDANNHTTTYGYNEISQVKSISDPLNKTINSDYDLAGNQTAIIYPQGNIIGFGYDKLDRLTSILFNDQNRYTFGYDSNGNITSVVDAVKSETTQFAYDADNKLINVTEPNSNKLDYTHDKTGNVTSLTSTVKGVNYTTNYLYDILEQLYNVTFGSSWAKGVFDENGNVTGTLNSNQTLSFSSYNDAGSLKNLKLLKGDSGNLGDYSYTYEDNGNITAISLSSDSFGSKTINYTYDALNRLTSETLRDGTLIEYGYDAVGNRLTKKATPQGGGSTTTNYSYDAANQLTAVNSIAYTYDDNGNIISDGSCNFLYDAANRLIKVTKKSDGSLVASFDYDGLGRRTSKTTASGTTKYFYDGDSTQVLYETDDNGNLLARYIYGQNDQLVAMVRGGSTYFYHYNGHGDVVALTDSTGAVVAEYDYDAWGNPVVTGLEGTVVNPYRYAGYRWDSETGLYYLNARYYAPLLGRFITRDSFHGFEDEPASLNQYAYAHGNPVMFVDPDGHWVWMVAGAAAGGYAGYRIGKNYGLKGIKLAVACCYCGW